MVVLVAPAPPQPFATFMLLVVWIRNRYHQTIYYLTNCTIHILIQNKACIITDNYIFGWRVLEELLNIFIVDFRKQILSGTKSVNGALYGKYRIVFTIVVPILNILKPSKCFIYSYSIFRMGTTIF